MNRPLPEILAAFARSDELLAEALQRSPDPQQRAESLAGVLRQLWPNGPLYACLFRAGDHTALGVLDASGRPRPEWAERLREQLTPRVGADHGPGTGSVPLPAALNLPGHALAVAETTPSEDRQGTLAVAEEEGSVTETSSPVRVLLEACARQLGLRLRLEDEARARQALQEELALQTGLAQVGELAGPVAHEFNNFLNTILLQVAVLELDAPERLRAEFAQIRRQGNEVTAVVKQLQQYRRKRQPVPQPLDLNRLVRETVATLVRPSAELLREPLLRPAPAPPEGEGSAPPPGVPVSLELAADLPPVTGSRPDLQRLLTFLLSNAAAVSPAVTVRTERADGWALLHVEDRGPAVDPGLLPRFFEPGPAVRPGTNSLELAACKTLVRRLQGKIQGENRPDGGLAVRVELPTGSR
jgi:signal transduction histidine kinase